MIPASAADNFAFDPDWWDQAPPKPGRGSAYDNLVRESNAGHYNGETTATHRGTWHNGDTLADLVVEKAGFAATNVFGWYGWWDISPDSSDAISGQTPVTGASNWYGDTQITYGTSTHTLGLYTIYDGAATPSSDTWSTWWDGWFNEKTTPGESTTGTYPERWGFWLSTEDSRDHDIDNVDVDGDGYDDGTVWLSEWLQNDGSYDGSSYSDRVYLEVFNDPRGYLGASWALAWEDRNIHDDSQYGSDFESDAAMNDRDREADYQDMILRFAMVDDETDIPEVPEPGTWVLLLATGAFGGWLKRRRES